MSVTQCLLLALPAVFGPMPMYLRLDVMFPLVLAIKFLFFLPMNVISMTADFRSGNAVVD